MATKFANVRVLNFPDSGDISIDPRGMEIPEKLPVVNGSYRDFTNGVGEATVRVDANGVNVDMDIFSAAVVGDLANGAKLYPSVGGIILDRIGTKVTKSRITCVVLSPTPNQDVGIRYLPKPA